MERNRIIMIIDDDHDDRSIFLDAVAHIDHSIICIQASDGIQGVKMLKCDKQILPDYIFLDLNLPRLNGFQCLAEIKKDPRLLRVPVIIYSTSRRIEDACETKRLGAAFFLTKPVLFGDICKAISDIIETKWGSNSPC